MYKLLIRMTQTLCVLEVNLEL